MKRIQKPIKGAFLLLAAFLLAACDGVNSPSDPTSYSAPQPQKVDFTLTEFEGEVEIHTDLQKDYFAAEDSEAWINEHSGTMGRKSASAPAPVTFAWDAVVDNGWVPDHYTVEVSKSQDFAGARTAILPNESITLKNLQMTNFEIGVQYYWRVKAEFLNVEQVFVSEAKTFTIADDAARNLDVEGVENFRDCGGWKVEGGRIKQGLLYRSAEFNGNEKGVSAPTEKGLKVLRDELGIKADLDVRRTLAANNNDEVIGITSSPLGEDIDYVSLPMVFGGSNIYSKSENKASIKAFFEYLADETHYPAVFHCVRGTDRTGALAYVIGALCGMNEDQLIQDYLFSNFANIGSTLTLNQFDGESFYHRQIAKMEGETLSEKAENYLLAKANVGHETVEAIRRILVEKD